MPTRRECPFRSLVLPARALFIALIAGLVLGSLGAPAGAADTTTSTPSTTGSSAPTPATVSADVLPTPQIDGVAWKQVIVGNTVFVGGEFTTARPFGAAPGVNAVARTNLLAYDVTTGTLDSSFAPAFNGKVADMAVTPDQSKLVVVGTFDSVNGETRNRVAVFDLPSRKLSTSVVPDLNGVATSVAATDTRLYFGGWFSAINGDARNRVGSVSAVDGSLLPFTVPVDNQNLSAIVVSPDGSQVVLAGNFTSVGGSSSPGYGLYRANAVTGAKLPLPVNNEVRNAGSSAGILRLASDSTSFYGTAWNFGGTGGNSEGVFQASWSDGSLVAMDDCHGDSYDVAPIGEVVYVASHKHYCGNSGGFSQTAPDWSYWHATAWTKSVRGTNTADVYGYASHPGTPRPGLLNWFPQFIPGSYTGQSQATWTVSGNSKYVVYGGEFTRVDGIAQQGLVRFAVRSIAPNKEGPRTQDGYAFSPTVRSYGPGQVHVSWPALWDRDDETLTYQLFRNGSGTKIHQTTQAAYQWNGRAMSFTDTGLKADTEVKYAVRVIDGSGNFVNSDYSSITVRGDSALDAYSEQVVGDGATKFWRLDEKGERVDDWAGADEPVAGAGVSRGVEGAIVDSTDAASSFNGTGDATIISENFLPAPDTFSQEVWFRTGSRSGGRISGYGDAPAGLSTSTNEVPHYDRHLYLDGNGRLSFGVYSGSKQVITAKPALNDEQWHQAVATLGPDGMTLYVDGAKVGSRPNVTGGTPYGGYWRLGADNTWSGGRNFDGALDDFSVYPQVLTPAQVQSHWTASKRQAISYAPPTAGFAEAAAGLKVTLRSVASSNSGGAVDAQQWSFGDGTTATGECVTHTYARPGRYAVQLTVDDSRGPSSVVTRQVSVANARPVARMSAVARKKRSVAFNATRSSDVDGRVVSYAWSFGDGRAGSGRTASHVFRRPGAYVVALTVTDNSGGKTRTTQRVVVRR